ncbi:MAG: hypothetical protein QNL96_09325 [SAR86 cluster bacterium]|jgi:hypothetical protein|uniref:DUF302 domain-containing protein n=1 Tax=SAR86 cluster bacterium TaxID=2030880 RepID=A0A972VY14_9GAMM|nr:hypothetical protein [SAR86 cluster bacterium]|tara:strand:+ start:24018 stop:24899 length:882 start_codon:yes stop_codon:yes gene_type:complete
MMKHTFKRLQWLILLTFAGFQSALADDNLKPYILTSATYESLIDATAAVTEKLTANGFQVVGQYSPYAGALVIGITSEALQGIAANTEHGGFGAVVRLSITEAEDGLQIAYVNPDYLAGIYRMDSLAEISSALATALGEGETFGSSKGLSAKKLAKYHYMMAMPYFDDVDVLAHYDSFADAINSVEKNLEAGVADTVKVYRVDVTGKEEALFGVGLRSGDGSDQTVMTNADLAETKHTAHLPYELLVSGTDVIALRGRFRIAQSFPDLTMGTFMKIRSAPGAIKNTLTQVAQP